MNDDGAKPGTGASANYAPQDGARSGEGAMPGAGAPTEPSATSSGADYRPERPADAGWLALRTDADNAARQLIIKPLLEPLINYLRGSDAVHVVDLGAGTGANARWLAPRLPFAQKWTLIDHDAQLLAQADAPVEFDTVAARMDELATILTRPSSSAAREAPPTISVPREAPPSSPAPGEAPPSSPAPGEARPSSSAPAAALLTCSALLDVLTAADVDSIASAVVASGAAALFSLSVTGEVRLSPADAFDSAVAREFNNHQRRGGRLGPDAPAAMTAALQRAGLTVHVVETPWELTGGNGHLLTAWLHGRAEAAVEQEPELTEAVSQWLQRRLDQLARGELSARVGHIDLLALPASPPERR